MSDILVKYYGDIKNQFYSGIALSDYPTIQWMNFSAICETVNSFLYNVNVVADN